MRVRSTFFLQSNMLSETISMMTLRNMDNPWRRLPWTLPTALLIWAAALWGLAYFMERPVNRPAQPPPIEVALLEQPLLKLEPPGNSVGPPGPAEAPAPAKLESKPIPPVPVKKEKSPQVKHKITLKTDARPEKNVKPEPQPTPVETIANADPNVGQEGAGLPAAPSAGSGVGSGGRQAGGGGSGGGSLEREFGSSDGPSFLRKTMPAYPPVAKRLQKEGNVLLRVTIDERGRPAEVEIVKKAGFGFDEEAVKAVQNSTFVPAKKEGRPLACKVLLPIRFVLSNS
jgi:protein TonB